MLNRKTRAAIGVMGSSNSSINNSEVDSLAGRLGEAIAARGCLVVTGATTGLPYKVAKSARARGAFSVGVSPAISHEEHVGRYGLPTDSSDVIIYTGFGLKGRNVVNVRSSDIVLIIGGGIGTLNEFTIAFDEGKIIGVLEGSGGIADDIRKIAQYSSKNVDPDVIFENEPELLIDNCLSLFDAKYSKRE